MCGITGIASTSLSPIKSMSKALKAMSRLIAHRGPDGEGDWERDDSSVGLVHRRLSIIDLSDAASQPMKGPNGTIIVFNGEVYNYKELRSALRHHWDFQSSSDTECILAAYHKYGESCVDHLRGMFAFAIWDERRKKLFCARDRFGIKPFYYANIGGVFYFASEAKALLPFLPEIETNKTAFAEYLTFQFTLGKKTLFSGVEQLLPAHSLVVENGNINIRRYWDVHYNIDYDHSPKYFIEKLRELVDESIQLHLRSDVPVGSYVSGGIDSSLMHILANRGGNDNSLAFHGRFTDYPGYDESSYATTAVEKAHGKLHIADITANDFLENIRKVLYHLDFPVAGPGAFPQFMVSKMASEQVKVVLGGQGGDEIFGGYTRYLIAYFEQCIRAAIDGNYKNGNFIVTIESIIPNLGLLREYKPLMKKFWSKGLFDSMDERYFHLIDRSATMTDEIEWDQIDKERVFEDFSSIFSNPSNVNKEAYFDKMTHFDFKTLLPALLQVEDRMSMAHGLESRVPLLDHPLVEFAATVPADIKFENGSMKRLLKEGFKDDLPEAITSRRDKMGFPVPLKEWLDDDLKGLTNDIFQNMDAKKRPFINSKAVLTNIGNDQQFSRKTWGLLSLELWHQEFHDKAGQFRAMVKD